MSGFSIYPNPANGNQITFEFTPPLISLLGENEAQISIYIVFDESIHK
ncbi:MAG: hypothetical protein R2764_00955 [Bacteroidales bacterium]